MKTFMQFLLESEGFRIKTTQELDQVAQHLIKTYNYDYTILLSELLDNYELSHNPKLLAYFKRNYGFLHNNRDFDDNEVNNKDFVKYNYEKLLGKKQPIEGQIQELNPEQEQAIEPFVRNWFNFLFNHPTNESVVIKSLNALGFNDITFIDEHSRRNYNHNLIENYILDDEFNPIMNNIIYQIRGRDINDYSDGMVSGTVYSRIINMVYDQIIRQDPAWDNDHYQPFIALISFFEEVMGLNINYPTNYEHYKNTIINSRAILSPINNQNQIFVFKK